LLVAKSAIQASGWSDRNARPQHPKMIEPEAAPDVDHAFDLDGREISGRRPLWRPPACALSRQSASKIDDRINADKLLTHLPMNDRAAAFVDIEIKGPPLPPPRIL
jgi:hypothetical protein